ncbi:ABC transporter permease [Clostridium thermosuccinogenes]|jgi:ATP-binding cassette subfamily B protein/subfamily B ATP-binding cassette protein MsbA|uniref:ABC transporter permease n=1 Tax=Clostridium thermosuccinogenes TaxID=84032 RepID=A0A2K2FKX4_9CLOT|nr:ABC transporter ATP-binding protein [Pseudoclostridium thermosuccinogenes]AUS96030.1 ABC transporter permease [Pseudoclostridium thermosuccinogenes]PNT93246.1 ABC transporter permease [Pseudoclostridium thermosuccinogenes]PNT99419.1 ABC transporter permease [Pseudoclostridium thermosuccinogenes]PNU01106.1 ABC transporter permease [Pseudoclostridium thermosuccinogenes]
MKELKALLHFAKPYKWYIALATLCMITVTAMNMVAPWMIRNIVKIITDGPSNQIDMKQVTILALTALAAYLIRAASQFGSDYISHYSAWYILNDIRRYMYEHMQKLPLKYFQDRQTGELMSRVMNDTRNFEELLAHAIPTLIVNALTLIGVSSILLSLNIQLTLYTLIPVPILIWLVAKFSKISRPRFKDAQVKIAEVNSILQDNFTGIKEIKVFTKEEYELKRTGKSIYDHTRSILNAVRLSNLFHPGIEFVSSLGTVIVIFFGGILALSNQLSLENMVAFLLYLNSFYQPVIVLGRINEGLQQALASAERVLEILDEGVEDYDKQNSIRVDRVKGDLEFRNVSFDYIKGITVLKDISFKAKAGETVALVGPTGVGKTTLANLIPRFYDPDAGQILIDGKDIRDMDLTSLRKQVSFVSQDVFLFNGTVKENILYGRLDASDEEVIAAAKAANAHDFIMELADGYNTQVGERGVKLSGGQKQRISIARAILKDAPILILDEATSSVDTQTERLIQEALEKLMKNRTTIVIAHRLSTIQKADQIIVIKEGKITEKGKHEELLELKGLYSQLCEAQSGGCIVA